MKATFQFVALCLLVSAQAFAAAIPIVDAVDAQPLSAQVKRVTDALTMLGAPLSKEADAALQKAMQEGDAAATVRGIQAVLDPLCIAYVNIIQDYSGGGTYAKRLPNAIAFGMWFPDAPYPGHDSDEHVPAARLHEGVSVLLEALSDLACGQKLVKPLEP